MTWITEHWKDIIALYTAVVTLASIIVKLTPTLKDDNWLLVVIKFVGKYIALDRTVNDEAVRKDDKLAETN